MKKKIILITFLSFLISENSLCKEGFFSSIKIILKKNKKQLLHFALDFAALTWSIYFIYNSTALEKLSNYFQSNKKPEQKFIPLTDSTDSRKDDYDHKDEFFNSKDSLNKDENFLETPLLIIGTVGTVSILGKYGTEKYLEIKKAENLQAEKKSDLSSAKKNSLEKINSNDWENKNFNKQKSQSLEEISSKKNISYQKNIFPNKNEIPRKLDHRIYAIGMRKIFRFIKK